MDQFWCREGKVGSSYMVVLRLKNAAADVSHAWRLRREGVETSTRCFGSETFRAKARKREFGKSTTAALFDPARHLYTKANPNPQGKIT